MPISEITYRNAAFSINNGATWNFSLLSLVYAQESPESPGSVTQKGRSMITGSYRYWLCYHSSDWLYCRHFVRTQQIIIGAKFVCWTLITVYRLDYQQLFQNGGHVGLWSSDLRCQLSRLDFKICILIPHSVTHFLWMRSDIIRARHFCFHHLLFAFAKNLFKSIATFQIVSSFNASI